jgi:hypothetical protein
MSEATAPTFSDEAQQRLRQQAFSLWVDPEIQRRSDRGLLPSNFAFLAAQIVFWPDGRPLEVRLNDEVRCSFVVEPTRNIVPEVDKLIGLDDINRVVEIHPPAEEADSGHVTILRLRETWCFTFDFTYNNARVAHTVKAARDFLIVAHECAEKGRYRPFVDALFSAVELMSKALMLCFPGPESLHWSHNKINRQLNLRRKDSIVGGDFAGLLNELARLRGAARYSCDDFSLEADVISKMRSRADEMLDLINQQIARRARELHSRTQRQSGPRQQVKRGPAVFPLPGPADDLMKPSPRFPY